MLFSLYVDISVRRNKFDPARTRSLRKFPFPSSCLIRQDPNTDGSQRWRVHVNIAPGAVYLYWHAAGWQRMTVRGELSFIAAFKDTTPFVQHWTNSSWSGGCSTDNKDDENCML